MFESEKEKDLKTAIQEYIQVVIEDRFTEKELNKIMNVIDLEIYKIIKQDNSI